jgi:hypothetical protein
MPYAITHDKNKNKWFVTNEATGSVKGTHDTEAKAKAQMRLLEGIEHGWTPTKSK